MTTEPATSLVLDIEAIRIPNSEESRALLESIQEANAAKSGTGPSGIKLLAKRKSDIFHVPPFDIHIDPEWNVRDFSDPENQQHVIELAHSIAALGKVVDPITVVMRDGVLYEWDGESRLRAVWYAINELHARIETVPCVTEPDAKTDEERLARMFAKEMGKRFKPMERARLAKRLIDHGWDVPRISQATGLSEMRINQLLALLDMPEQVQQQVASGVVSATLAAEVVREHGEGAADAIQQAAAQNGGAKAGRATKAALKSVSGGNAPLRESAVPLARQPDGSASSVDDEDADLSSHLEKALQDVQRLTEENESLRASLESIEDGKELLSLKQQRSALDSRNREMAKEIAELKRSADFNRRLFEQIRKALSVANNSDIMGAIYDLKG